jgi:CheY-like chemotaxis protein
MRELVNRDPRPPFSGLESRGTMPDRTLKILVVEDHGDTSRLMARLLQGHGHDVRVAEGVQSALTVAQHESFDLLISDIGLPDGTGLELMKQIQAIRPTKGIALSGYSSSEDVRDARDAGFAAHVTKPVDFSKLQELIEQLV